MVFMSQLKAEEDKDMGLKVLRVRASNRRNLKIWILNEGEKYLIFQQFYLRFL